MGMTSFIQSVWRPVDDAPLLSASVNSHVHDVNLENKSVPVVANPAINCVTDALPGYGQFYSHQPTCDLRASSNAPRIASKSPGCRSFKHIAFTLPDHLYAWLESMAVIHNYGSVHKSIRDLLGWACTGQDEDLDWIFLTSHSHIDDSLSFYSASATSSVASSSSSSIHEFDDPDALTVAGKQSCARLATRRVALDARVSNVLYSWIIDVIDRYSLDGGPSVVFETLVRCAIELQAADDIFESDECGHDLPESTAELYHDLGLIKHNWSSSPSSNLLPFLNLSGSQHSTSPSAQVVGQEH